ncbi:MAG TPA: type II toxin-antitoxin system VapC family toxin, partial [Leptospiraceae bacterium]|nr:type II toxin-antitoxin system VapC family toxin [Leptospiraceae bacterium]
MPEETRQPDAPIDKKRIALMEGTCGVPDRVSIRGQVVDIPVTEKEMELDWDMFLGLPRIARETIMSADNAVYVSAVTGWEVATKHRLGKFPEAGAVIARLPEITVRAGIETLPLEFSHGVRSGNYRHSHGDPFDRMLA